MKTNTETAMLSNMAHDSYILKAKKLADSAFQFIIIGGKSAEIMANKTKHQKCVNKEYFDKTLVKRAYI